MPAEKQACPNSALCWSPATPPITSGAPSHAGSTSPNGALDGNERGIMAAGMSSARRRSVSQSCVWMLNSIVRAALLWSVTWVRPLVSCQISQLSTVPKASSPASACARAPGT